MAFDQETDFFSGEKIDEIVLLTLFLKLRNHSRVTLFTFPDYFLPHLYYSGKFHNPVNQHPSRLGTVFVFKNNVARLLFKPAFPFET